MRNIDKPEFEKMKITISTILVAWTSEPDYEMYKKILIELPFSRELRSDMYAIVEGGHCSCYGFDDTEWVVTEYTKNELKTLAKADYNKNSEFWESVRTAIGVI